MSSSILTLIFSSQIPSSSRTEVGESTEASSFTSLPGTISNPNNLDSCGVGGHRATDHNRQEKMEYLISQKWSRWFVYQGLNGSLAELGSSGGRRQDLQGQGGGDGMSVWKQE